MRPALGVLADACCVLAFVVIGRANHHVGEALAGVVSTAWPFLAGVAVGEVVTRAWRQPTALIPAGVGVWLSTVVIGQGLRVIAGQGTEFAFILVSLAFLGLFLLGWRVVARILAVRTRIPG